MESYIAATIILLLYRVPWLSLPRTRSQAVARMADRTAPQKSEQTI